MDGASPYPLWELWAKRFAVDAAAWLEDCSLPLSPMASSEAPSLAILDDPTCDVLCLCGVYVEKIYSKIALWLSKSDHRSLVIVAHCPQIISQIAMLPNAGQILRNEQVALHYVPMRDLGSIRLEEIVAPYSLLKWHFIASCAADVLCNRLQYRLGTYRRRFAAYAQAHSGYYANAFQNICQLPGSYSLNTLNGAFCGVPAIICGAGPSLAKQADVLRSLLPKALFLAGGTAVNVLNALHIDPHLIVTVDPHPSSIARVLAATSICAPHCFRLGAHALSLRWLHGESIYIPGAGGHSLAPYVEQQLGINSLDIVDTMNVVTLAVVLARSLGCSPIILVGCDLAYTSFSSDYAPCVMHPAFIDKAVEASSEKQIWMRDIFGKPIATNSRWLAESNWLSYYAKEHPELVLFNATEGGIGAPPIPNTSLHALDSYFQKNKIGDLDMRLHAALYCGNRAVSKKKTQCLLKDMRREIGECLSLCKKLLEENSSDLTSSAATTPWQLDAPIKGKLEANPSYVYFLGEFDAAFKEVHKRDIGYLENNTFGLTGDALQKRRVDMRKSYLSHLIQVTSDALNHVVTACNLDTGEGQSGLLAFAPLSLFAKKALPIDLCEQGYTAMALSGKRVHYFYEEKGYLEKEAYVIGKRGEVLAKCGYKRGKREGLATFFYPNGALYRSIEYRDGVRSGIQREYYPSGILKALLPYKKGLIDGSVVLYYPSGAVKLKACFQRGQRCGLEQAWKENGEVFYKWNFE